ncbi:MAG: hypothetical protein U0984_19500 [Prosthecobacter sp.]|nr:hypothetical protein [Prosthecobacter sp.]
MTVETDFAINRGFTLKVNFDPRLFLSNQPTALPPVPGSWYREQSETERATTHENALAYLRKNLELRFGDEPMPLPQLKLEAIDGSDNTPLKPETAEVHLLATGRSVIPGSGSDFRLSLGRDANVSLILLSRIEGGKDASPRVVFPGETSQAFSLFGVKSLDEIVSRFSASGKSEPAPYSPWMMRAVIVVTLIVIWLLFMRKRASQALPDRRRRR